jgi:ATP:ADP antiporter, AAA family
MANPLKAVLNIKREELPLSLLMFGYFFLVITSFWILKPIKKSLFIGFYQADGFTLGTWHLQASQAELIAKVLNMVVAFVAVAVFSWLSRRLKREQLTYTFTLFFMVAYLLYSTVINTPGPGLVWSFYLFGDLFSTLMVATFFVFLNDSVTPERAKRIYGLVGLGGVTGGAFGSTIVRAWISELSNANWLWICFAVGILIVLFALAASRLVNRGDWRSDEAKAEPALKPEAPAEKPGGNPALEGARLVFRSKYLLSIVAIVGLYEVVSTIIDFQFTATIEHFVSGDRIGEHFASIFAITNWVSMFVQLFLTSFIMTRFGLSTALSFLPAAILLGAAGFLVAPVLWIGSLLNTTDNGFSYSINQSAKETLYVPTTREEKYKAKAFIDMFVQRFAKVLAVVVSLAITGIFKDFSSVRWLSLLVVVLVFFWSFAVRYAGRAFKEKTDGKQV